MLFYYDYFKFYFEFFSNFLEYFFSFSLSSIEILMVLSRSVAILQMAKSASFQRLREVTASVFGQVIRTTNQRLGYQNLLKEPQTGNYFPDFNPRLLQSTYAWKDDEMEYMKTRLARLREKGKGPPKKGLFSFFFSFVFL